jgi:hypothetical protein
VIKWQHANALKTETTPVYAAKTVPPVNAKAARTPPKLLMLSVNAATKIQRPAHVLKTAKMPVLAAKTELPVNAKAASLLPMIVTPNKLS